MTGNSERRSSPDARSVKRQSKSIHLAEERIEAGEDGELLLLRHPPFCRPPKK